MYKPTIIGYNEIRWKKSANRPFQSAGMNPGGINMREKKKTVDTFLLCFALLFGAVGALVATRPAVAEEKTANVIAVNKINTAAGIQI